MTSNDVRSILNLPQPVPTSILPRKSVSTHRKPEGISRELYALIGENAPSLAEAQASVAAVKYRERPKPKSSRVKWEWTFFNPAARQRKPVRLAHWARVTDEDPHASVSYFAGFNAYGPSVVEYSQYEYDQHLVDVDWSSQETAYLFDLLREYDLRFVIAADRYEYTDNKQGTTKTRSVEDIKDRYYTICRRLLRTRTATDPHTQQHSIQAHSFDKIREVKRKQYASELFHLTAAEIAEEEALYIEMKRMEQNDRRYRSDRDDLLRNIMGLDSGIVNLDQANAEGVLGLERNKKRKRLEDGELAVTSPVPVSKKQKESAAYDAARCLYRVPVPPISANTSHLAAKHPVHLPVHLRSTRLPTPKPQANIRITELLGEMGINTHRLVMPTRNNIEVLERLFEASGALVDLKRQVDRVDQEVRTLKAQGEGFVPAAERKMRSESVGSTDTSATGRRSRAG